MTDISAPGANETRGEIGLELGGTDYVLRPSYEAIQSIEKKTGKGIMALARDAARIELTLQETAIIAAECIRAQGRATDDRMLAAVNADRIGELIIETEGGIAGVMGRIMVLLELAATGGYDRSGELRPAKAAAEDTGTA